MLRIKLVVSAQNELEPTEYLLIDKYQAFTQNIKPKNDIIMPTTLRLILQEAGMHLLCTIDANWIYPIVRTMV
jgi:hypothetical protein